MKSYRQFIAESDPEWETEIHQGHIEDNNNAIKEHQKAIDYHKNMMSQSVDHDQLWPDHTIPKEDHDFPDKSEDHIKASLGKSFGGYPQHKFKEIRSHLQDAAEALTKAHHIYHHHMIGVHNTHIENYEADNRARQNAIDTAKK